MSGRGESVTVRRATREDWPRMAELDRELARFEKLPEPSDEDAARLAAMLFGRRRIEALRRRARGFDRRDGDLLGGARSSFRARTFLFLGISSSARAARSRGVGEALMAALAREGAARGRADRLVVLDWNADAMRFYRRIGAAPAKDWVRYSLPEDAMERLAGRRRLPVRHVPEGLTADGPGMRLVGIRRIESCRHEIQQRAGLVSGR